VAVEKGHHLNHLLRELPAGLLVDSDWLQKQGLSHSRIHDYVRKGWLERVIPRVYRRPAGASACSTAVRWEVAVASAQALTDEPFHVGGTTALDLLGLSHFLDLGGKTRVWLYDAEAAAPSWLAKLPVSVELKLVRRRLFQDDELGLEWRRLDLGSGRVGGPVERPDRSELWDQFLRMATAERATLEMLDAVGIDVGFHSADRIFEGLANLRPALTGQLLESCTSVKAKRLFFFYADRHGHGWAKRLDPATFDLGTGKRQIAKGGRLDPKYQITVPVDFLGGNDEPDDG
jgi:hypothetical protein